MSGGAACVTPTTSIKEEHSDVWALVVRTQAGDMEAFGLIYETYWYTIFRFAYLRTGSACTAEDIVSETFLRAYARINSFTYKGRDLGAWLVTIARNLVRDEQKSKYHTSVRLVGDFNFFLDIKGVKSSAHTEHAALDSITNAKLREAILKLTPLQRRCIVLRFIQQVSLVDTAKLMNKSVGAVKALQHEGVKRLRDHVTMGTTLW